MRKYLIPVVAAASALAVAAPASAQWAPPVYNYQPYNYGNGFSYQRFSSSMQVRVQRLRSDIRNLRARGILSPGEARSLEAQASDLQRRIFRHSRNGIGVREARNLESGIRNLENRISREARDWNNRPNRRRH
jgi:predicted RNase H-like nuclease (RuvC/YqgF family)